MVVAPDQEKKQRSTPKPRLTLVKLKSNSPSSEFITEHFLHSHFKRAKKHNSDMSLQSSDFTTLIVEKMLFDGDGYFDTNGYNKTQLLNVAFRNESNRQLDVLLASLKRALCALRTAFNSHLAEIELPGWHCCDWIYNTKVKSIEDGFESPEHDAYKDLVASLFRPNPVSQVPYGTGVYPVDVLLNGWSRVAQWDDRRELTAWSANRCLCCAGHIVNVNHDPDWRERYVRPSYGRRSYRKTVGLETFETVVNADATGRCGLRVDEFWHTALCGKCQDQSMAGKAWYTWIERPIHDELLAISTLIGLAEADLPSRVWMRHHPGIPIDAVFAHDVVVDGVAVSVVDRARVAQIVAAAAAARDRREKQQNIARRERRIAKEARRREKIQADRKRVASYQRRVFRNYRHRMARLVKLHTPDLVHQPNADSSSTAAADAAAAAEQCDADISEFDFSVVCESLDCEGLSTPRRGPFDQEEYFKRVQNGDRVDLDDFKTALQELQCRRPELCGVKMTKILSDADAHLAKIAPQLSRFDVHLAEKRLNLPNVLPIYSIESYKNKNRSDPIFSTKAANCLLGVFFDNLGLGLRPSQ